MSNVLHILFIFMLIPFNENGTLNGASFHFYTCPTPEQK